MKKSKPQLSIFLVVPDGYGEDCVTVIVAEDKQQAIEIARLAYIKMEVVDESEQIEYKVLNINPYLMMQGYTLQITKTNGVFH